MSERRVLLFTGMGKGKSTAALGMALRSFGHGMRVAVFHFVKSRRDVGEVMAIDQLAGIDQTVCGKGFLPPKDDPAFAEHVAAAEAGLAQAQAALNSGEYRLIVLDEICYAVHRGLLDEAAVCELVKSAPTVETSLVLTGRQARESLMELADTVTEMRPLKHGYDQGIAAQDGIEK